MVLAGFGIALAVATALVLMWRRQHQLAQQLEALRASLDQVRLDVAHLRNPQGPHGGRVRPRPVRRRRHLQLLSGTAAAIEDGAAWARRNRATTFLALAAVLGMLAAFAAVNTGVTPTGLPDPEHTQALEVQRPRVGVPPDAPAPTGAVTIPQHTVPPATAVPANGPAQPLLGPVDRAYYTSASTGSRLAPADAARNPGSP